MTMTSTTGVADFRGTAMAANESEAVRTVAQADAPMAVPTIWVLCRRKAGGAIETLRAFEDETRARADLDLAETISPEEFWVAAVPLIASVAPAPAAAGGALSRVQALALTWLAQGAEADAPMPVDDPVVISPQHVRGFVSVPPHEWREMEDRGWVRDGLITPAGAAAVGLDAPVRAAANTDSD